MEFFLMPLRETAHTCNERRIRMEDEHGPHGPNWTRSSFTDLDATRLSSKESF